MCGIAGIVDQGAGLGRQRMLDIVLSMRETMVHRGPDDAGVWIDPSDICALAHRRLSIIDLSPEARQPIGNENNTVQATFNGELYNYLELRAALQLQGHSFRTQTDSEVLPHLFETMDPQQIDQLDGMFSFGIWHRERRQILLARDPFGKKPLYYSQGPGWLAFASELQALTRVPQVDLTVNPDALALYLLLQYIPHPVSIFKGIHKLPPGAYLSANWDDIRKGQSRVEPYYTFQAQEPVVEKRSNRELLEELRVVVREAVQKRLMSDVPLGAFLSGGVDSSLVVAMARKELGLHVQTFSIGFEDTGETEHLYAREVAEFLGTEHHEQLLNADAVSQIPQIAARLDEPNGDSSCLPTYLLAEYTKQFVTVALSGDGGDEMFGGYGRYQGSLNEADHWFNRFTRSLKNKKWFSPADAYLSPRWLIFQPEQVEAFMGGPCDHMRSQVETWRDFLNDSRLPFMHRMRTLDANTYMPGAVLAKVDRMSMQASLEVRCPLLDKEVGRFASRLRAQSCWSPPDTTKLLLKQLASEYLPEKWMTRTKMGFGLPSKTWSHQALLGLARDSILAPTSQLSQHLDVSALTRFLQQQEQPGYFSVYRLWPVLLLELWLRNFQEVRLKPHLSAHVN